MGANKLKRKTSEMSTPPTTQWGLGSLSSEGRSQAEIPTSPEAADVFAHRYCNWIQCSYIKKLPLGGKQALTW